MKLLSPLVEQNTTSLSSPVKVCMHVLGDVKTDGRAMRAATALVEAGFAVSILDIAGEGPSEENIGDIHIQHMTVSTAFIATRFKMRILFRAAKMLFDSTVRLFRMPADVYHALDLPALPACYITARLRRKPIIFESYELPLATLSLSDMSMGRRCLQALVRPLLAYIIPRCSGVIAVSPPIVKEMHKRYHAPIVKLVRNIPGYQAVTKNDRLRKHLGLSAETRIALYQGNVQPDRCLDLLVRAARFVAPNVHIVIMGKAVGTTPSQLETLIASEGVAERVTIIPPVPGTELLDWTASADIGLAIYDPSYSMNVEMMLPNKLFEYLMAGLPVLSSALESITEVVKGYDVGQIVSSIAPEAIGTGINAILADRDALARMQHNALHVAKEELCWEKEGRHLVDLYHTVIHV